MNTKLLMLSEREHKLLEELIEFEIKHRACFYEHADSIEVTKALIALWERI